MQAPHAAGPLPAPAPEAAASTARCAEPPLVSVLVRSLDRAPLQQALASLGLQSHARIEVLVIAAQPGHAPLPAQTGPHALRLLPTETPRPRSLAANAGLDAAQGDFLLFLDDDDWLAPDHIARLVQALQAMPEAMAAYAGVALVDAAGAPLGQVFDLPFDAVRLLSGNLTPIHAVLFSRRLCELGCRFDESLDRYEDWDFWLQVARHTVPLHVPGVSAFYRIHDSSGVHADAGADSASSQRIQAKWLQLCRPGQMGDLMRRVWSHDELEQRLAQAEAAAGGREALLAQALASLYEQGGLLHTLQVQQQALADATERRYAEQQQLLLAQQEQLASQHARAEGLARELGDQQARAAQLQQALADEARRSAVLRLDNEALLRSTSWRVTRPLRALMALLRGAGGGVSR